MIAQIEGKISYLDKNFAVVNNSGIGYKIFLSREIIDDLIKQKLEKASFWIYEAIREDACDLYGFSDRSSMHFFELLLSVSGIGPKSALAILNIAPIKTLRSAIATGDPAHLTKTTGIGTKKAEKIILELKDKLEVSEGDISEHKDESDVIEALKALGYSEKEVRDAMKKVPKDTISTESKIKIALKNLGK